MSLNEKEKLKLTQEKEVSCPKMIAEHRSLSVYTHIPHGENGC